MQTSFDRVIWKHVEFNGTRERSASLLPETTALRLDKNSQRWKPGTAFPPCSSRPRSGGEWWPGGGEEGGERRGG